MSTTFTWSVLNMATYPMYESQTDVVFQVAYSCVANQDTYYATNTGATNVVYVAGSPYTPYDQLTQDQVLGWVFQNIQKDFIESQLQAEVDKQVNPPYVYPPLPWVTPAA